MKNGGWHGFFGGGGGDWGFILGATAMLFGLVHLVKWGFEL